MESRGSVGLIPNFLGCSSQQCIIAQVSLPTHNQAFTISYLTVTITLTLESTISCPIRILRNVVQFEILWCVRTSGLYGVVLELVRIFSDVHDNTHTLFHSWWKSNSLYCKSMYAYIRIRQGTLILCIEGTNVIPGFIYVQIFITVTAILHKY